MLIVVQFSSSLSQLQAAVSAVADIDVSLLSGASAASLLHTLTPLARQLSALSSSCAARAVEANQHTLQGASSAGAWVAQQLGVSEEQARSTLAMQKRLAVLPEVDYAVRSGEISSEKAAIVARAAKGDVAVARTLLACARTSTLEGVQRKVQELAQSREGSSKSRQERLRHSQYVSIGRDDDNMVLGKFRLLPEVAAAGLARWAQAEREALKQNDTLDEPLPVPVARAEAFGRLLSSTGGKSSTTIAFHVDFDAWQRGWAREGERCEIAGLGPVPVSVIESMYDDSALRLLLTSRNRLLWYSEEDRRKKRGLIPDYIKRAVKSASYDMCETDNCLDRSVDVDHIQARVNGGGDELSNLQGLCERDHDAKTKRDVPWTVPRYFAPKIKREIIPEPAEGAASGGGLFADSG